MNSPIILKLIKWKQGDESMAHVITLTGPSMCGKSKVIRQLEILSNTPKYKNKFNIAKVPKYTTRPFRDNEIKAVLSGKLSDLDVLPVIGQYNESSCKIGSDLAFERFVAFNQIGCDLVYEQYGQRYGIKLSDLYEYIRQGISPVIILNDVRAIEDIKTLLGKQCVSLFVFRDVPNLERFEKEGKIRQDSEKTIQTRYEKATAIYRIYIENISLFDRMILNVRNGEDSLNTILDQFIESISSEPKSFI